MSGPYITLGANIVTTDTFILNGKNTLAFTSAHGIYLKYPNIYANTNTNSSMNLYASNGFTFYAGATRLLNIDVNGIISCNGLSCSNGVINSTSSIATSGSVTCSSLNCNGVINGVTSLNSITLSGSTISGVTSLSCNSLTNLTLNGNVTINNKSINVSNGQGFRAKSSTSYFFIFTWYNAGYIDFTNTLYFRLANTDGSLSQNNMSINSTGLTMNNSSAVNGGGSSITTSKLLIGGGAGPMYSNCGVMTGNADSSTFSSFNMRICSHQGIGFCYDNNITSNNVVINVRTGRVNTPGAFYYNQSSYQNFSDIRIKTNIVDIDDVSALATLRLIEPKRYNYIDVTKGSDPVWGFIAQQVRSVLPYSTSLIKKDIPNIYDFANVASDMITITLSTKSTSLFQRDASGDLCKITIHNNSNISFTLSIASIIDDKTFVITEALTDEQLYNVSEILVVGSFVDDFHALDKAAIFTIATAALQELNREYQETKLEIDTLTSQVANLITQVNLLMSNVKI